MSRRVTRFVCILFIAMMMLCSPAYASDLSYTYNKYREPVPSLAGYEALEAYKDFTCGGLNAPADIYIRDPYCYIADTNNNRILIFNIADGGFALDQVIDSFSNNDGTNTFAKPEGVFATAAGEIFIADTSNERIVKLDSDGSLIKVYSKPSINVMPADYNFYPQKIVVDENNRMYVVAMGMTEGLIQLDREGGFIRFYGSNPVRPNVFELLFRNFLTEEQISRRRIFIPLEYSNVAISNERFIYTTTLSVLSEQVKLLNFNGQNIIRTDNLMGKRYGDLYINPSMADVGVDSFDNIYALDEKSGRIYQYNSASDLMFVFGGIGDKTGTFKKPSSIAVAEDGRVFVTDNVKNNVTVFQPTEFGKLVLEANDYYIEGYFKESRSLWSEIISRDANYTLAYKSIGSAYMQEKQYADAMKYYMQGRDFNGYSKAFEKYRTEFLRKNFSVICSAFLFIAALLFVFKNIMDRFFKRIADFVG